jgi:pimeloyl-ACP methyl ester carboxylesterase
VVTLGQGPHVLMLHGFLQSSWAWRLNLDALARRFTVHALCVPGAGWSDKPAVAYGLHGQAKRVLEAMTALGVQKAHMIGNSLGGALALQVALEAPTRVDRLVLVAPAGAGVYPATIAASLQHPLAAPLLGLPGVGPALKLALQWGAYPRMAVDDAVMHRFLQPLRSPGGARAALAMARSFPRDVAALERRLGEIHQPVLLIWGECDRVVPLEAVLRVQGRLRDARLERFDCSGHCPMEEEPERFHREVLAFLLPAKSEAA